MRRPDRDKPDSLVRARNLRRDQSEPERRLWAKLRNRQLANLKFRRQSWVGRYVADFLCAEARLVVEVDGDTHAFSQAQDAERTAFIESEGFRVIRFTNTEVMTNMDGVLAHITDVAQAPHPALSPEGRG